MLVRKSRARRAAGAVGGRVSRARKGLGALGALKAGGAKPDKLHAAGPPQQATLAAAAGGADPAPPPPPPPPLVPHRSQTGSAFKAAAAGERMVRKLSFGKSKRGKGDLQGEQGGQP